MVGKIKNSSGFTIVELIIVIIVVGILATIVVISYRNTTRIAENSLAKTEALDIANNLEAVRTASRSYPDSIDDCPTPAASNLCLNSKNDFTYSYQKNEKGGSAWSTNVSDGYELTVFGDEYFFYLGATPITGTREFMQYTDLAPIIDHYGLVKYRLSFYIKSQDISNRTNAMVYFQNGSTARYTGLYTYVDVTTSFEKHTIEFTPTLKDTSTAFSKLAFYGVYDSGNILTVEDVRLSIVP